VRREVGPDHRAILSITKPADERDTRTKSRGSDQRRCDVSSRLSLARLNAAFIVRQRGVHVEQVINRNAADPNQVKPVHLRRRRLVLLGQGLVLDLRCRG
jgi:hypothetical protein